MGVQREKRDKSEFRRYSRKDRDSAEEETGKHGK